MDPKRQLEFTTRWTQAEPVVRSYAASLVGDFHQVEDVMQDVAATLLRKYDEYDASRPFVAWAIGMARYEVLHAKRAVSRSFLSYQSDLVDLLAEAAQATEAQHDRETQALHRCLESVQGRGARVLKLRYADALKPQEIADEMGMSYGAVRTALSRLRRELEDCVRRRIGGEATA